MSDILNNDVDPIETRDWLQAIESVIREEGVERAQFLIDQVLNTARQGGVSVAAGAAARNYINTIPVEDEPAYQATWSWNVVSVLLSAGTLS